MVPISNECVENVVSVWCLDDTLVQRGRMHVVYVNLPVASGYLILRVRLSSAGFVIDGCEANNGFDKDRDGTFSVDCAFASCVNSTVVFLVFSSSVQCSCR